MNKEIKIKDSKKIGETIAHLQNLANVLSDNLQKLDSYNAIYQIIDKEMIYEITTYRDEKSKENILKYFGKKDIFEDANVLHSKLSKTIALLYTPKTFDLQYRKYPEMYLNLPALLEFNAGYFNSKYEKKEAFNYDYINNKVTINPDMLNLIENDYTKCLTSEKELNIYDSMNKINLEIENIKKYYNDRGDNVTYNVYRNIMNCFTSERYAENRKLNEIEIYNNLIA